MIILVIGSIEANRFGGASLGGYKLSIYIVSLLPSIIGGAIGIGFSLIIGLEKASSVRNALRLFTLRKSYKSFFLLIFSYSWQLVLKLEYRINY